MEGEKSDYPKKDHLSKQGVPKPMSNCQEKVDDYDK